MTSRRVLQEAKQDLPTIALAHAPDRCCSGGCPHPCLHLRHRWWWWLEEVENTEVETELCQHGTLVGGGDGSNDLDWLHDTEMEGCKHWEHAEEPRPSIGWWKKRDQS